MSTHPARILARWRLLAYGLLALVAYGVAMVGGRGTGFAVFLGVGVVFEVLFWLALLRRVRTRGVSPPEHDPGDASLRG